jgi:hypothetical protein
MKKIITIISICFLVFFIACNPQAGKAAIDEVVKLKASLNNTNENINLGDTLKVTLKLPDTLLSNLRNIPIQSLQRGTFAMRIFKVDTVNKKGINILSPNVWVSAGSTEGQLGYVLKNNAKPYEVIINVSPKEKGMYYLEIIPQPGTLKINDIETNLLVGFNVPDYHYNILGIIAPYFGGQIYYDAIIQSNNEGFGVYFFRVI